MPLAWGFLKKEEIPDEIKIPLDLYFCENCKLVQICTIVDPVKLFKNYFYISSVIPQLSTHFAEYATYLKQNFLDHAGTKLLEMGCNDGVLLQNFRNNKDVLSLGIDPSENVCQLARNKWLKVINDFFNEKSASYILQQYWKFDVVTGSNVFAHIDDISEIIKWAKMLLHKNSVFIFEVHYLANLMKDFQYDTIYHEHLTYYSVTAAKKIFEINNMKIIDVIHLEMHGGGIRVITALNESERDINPRVNEFLQQEALAGLDKVETFLDFWKQAINHKKELYALLKKIKDEGKSIVGYGAAGRGTILLNYCDIDTSILDYIVDVSPLRQGMLMPGTHIEIKNPSVARKNPPDFFFVLAWNYVDSIIKQERDLQNKGVKFIVPFPKINIL